MDCVWIAQHISIVISSTMDNLNILWLLWPSKSTRTVFYGSVWRRL